MHESPQIGLRLLKVLYVLQNPNVFTGRRQAIGGHISHMIGVIESFLNLGHEVVVQSYAPIPFWSHPGIRYRWFRTPETPFAAGRGLIRQLRITGQIISAVRREKPDLLYLRWAENLFFVIVRWLFPKAAIVLECNTPLEMAAGRKAVSPVRRRVNRWVDRGYVRSATLISAVSSETRAFLLKRHPSPAGTQIIVNPNGVDTDRFRPLAHPASLEPYGIPKDALVIGWAGNFSYYHRTDLLIRAFQRLDTDHAHLVVLGAGHQVYEEQVHRMAEEHRASQIHFTGPVPFDQMPACLSACDILVSCQGSSFEDRFHGSPTKLFEYMAVGRAIVASRIGQIQEVIHHNRNGLLFEPGSVEDLESMLRRLVPNEELRRELGARARRDVEGRYTWDANVGRILAGIR